MTTHTSTIQLTSPGGDLGTSGTPGDASPARPEQRAANGRLSFDGVLRGEWIKLLSLRSIRWSIAVMLVISWAGAALLSLAMVGTDYLTPEAMPQLIVQSATFGSMFTVLIMGVLGVLSMSSEYASGLILSSLSAVPARTPVLAAKALVVAALGFTVGALSTFGGGLLAAAIFGDFSSFGDPAVLVSMLGNTLYLTLAALVALGIGALLRSSAGAISVVVVLLFVSTIVLQVLMMTGWEWVPTVSEWMPAALGNTLSTVTLTPAEFRGDVSYWGALGGLAAWAAAALVPAAVLLKTRDAV